MSRLLPLAVALCWLTQAGAEARIELAVAPAWKGWSRPGRATELDIRLDSAVAARAALDVAGGRQSVAATVELQPGRPARLPIVVPAAPALTVSARSPSAPPAMQDVVLSLSESPLLGVGLVADDRVQLDGFQPVALGADDLPRNALAYASIDALILDAPTLAALDQRQLAALIAYVADCGRLVVLNADPRVRALLGGAGGCAGHAALHAGSLPEARTLLTASLATSRPPALSMGSVGALARPSHAVWNAVALAVAIYVAAAALALVWLPPLAAALGVPALAIVAFLTLPQALRPGSQLVVWSEGESGARLARYQAWQRFPGVERERVRVPLPPQLGAAARACEQNQEMRFDVDASGALVQFAEFETRLFRQVALCYAGTFPIERAITLQKRADGAHVVRNGGARAWPRGVLLVGGRAHDLPAVALGAEAIVGAEARQPAADAALQLATTRARGDGAAALWSLDLAGVAGAPLDSIGWLLVAAAPPSRR